MLVRMVAVVQNAAIDCADAFQPARFWSAATGCPQDRQDAPGDRETRVPLTEGPALSFHQVPEPKQVKNRVHLCLRPKTSRGQEGERLLALGATFVADHRHADGSGGAVPADPNASN